MRFNLRKISFTKQPLFCFILRLSDYIICLHWKHSFHDALRSIGNSPPFAPTIFVIQAYRPELSLSIQRLASQWSPSLKPERYSFAKPTSASQIRIFLIVNFALKNGLPQETVFILFRNDINNLSGNVDFLDDCLAIEEFLHLLVCLCSSDCIVSG